MPADKTTYSPIIARHNARIRALAETTQGPTSKARDWTSVHPASRVAKHPHPWTVFFPRSRIPGILNTAKHTFRMGHDDSEAAIFGGESADALG